LGFAAEKRAFRPHVTLARLGHPANTTGWITSLSVPAESVSLEQLVLFRSELAKAGARYTRLAEVLLGEPTT
jgi:2'-5' RNA ligase